jgi:glycosyltransferase involved in cell wall biosynthesis
VGCREGCDPLGDRWSPFTPQRGASGETEPARHEHGGSGLSHAQVNSSYPGAQAAEQRPPAVPRVSVVIPALNEALNLPHVFSRLPQDVFEVILVDGGSVDDTVAVARALRPDVRVVRQNRRGKGNALACGFVACRGDIIVMIDADGSTDPAEIPAFVAALRAGVDFAKGTRFADGGGSADITPLRRLGNRALNGLVNVLYGNRYTDLCYGYNAFWRHCLDVLELHPGAEDKDAGMRWGDGFEIETIINARVARGGLTITEVASFEQRRIHGASGLNATRDGLRVLRSILHERWGPRRSVTRRRSRGTLSDLAAHNWLPRPEPTTETAVR